MDRYEKINIIEEMLSKIDGVKNGVILYTTEDDETGCVARNIPTCDYIDMLTQCIGSLIFSEPVENRENLRLQL